jgi:glycosyltransferase involved in cell wall biosynthesis
MSSQPRSIVIDARISGSSTGRYSENLVKHLAEIDNKHRYTVLVREGYYRRRPALPPNWSYRIADYSLNGTLGEQVGLARELRSLKPDLVHFTMPQQPLLYRGLSITTIHDLTSIIYRNPATSRAVSLGKRSLYKWLIRHVSNKADRVITVSEYSKDAVRRLTGQAGGKFLVTYEAADLIPEGPEAFDALEGQRFIMYVGRAMPFKNLDRLVDAYGVLKERHEDLHLVLAGKRHPNHDKLIKTVQDRHLDGVHFTGFVSEGQLRWLYHHCSAYVFPSLSEGFGLPGLEAMAHGSPVASSSATSLPEIYGDAARYFDPLDLGSMIGAIDDLLTSPELRQDLIDKGYRRVASYSWERMARQTLGVYEELLAA